jgi:hypothetical protein
MLLVAPPKSGNGRPLACHRAGKGTPFGREGWADDLEGESPSPGALGAVDLSLRER